MHDILTPEDPFDKDELYRGYGQVNSFNFVKIYSTDQTQSIYIIVLIIDSYLYYSMDKTNFEIMGAIVKSNEFNFFPSCFRILNTEYNSSQGLTITILCSQPANQIFVTIKQTELDKIFKQANQQNLNRIMVYASQIRKTIPYFILEAMSNNKHQFYLNQSVFFLIKPEDKINFKDQQSGFMIYRQFETPTHLNYYFTYSSLLAAHEPQLNAFKEINWICFRVVPMPETYESLNFLLILAGIHQENTLIIKYISLAINKVGGYTKFNQSQDLWKFLTFVNINLDLSGVDFCKFFNDGKNDKNPTQKYLLFLSNGEVILEYKVEIQKSYYSASPHSDHQNNENILNEVGKTFSKTLKDKDIEQKKIVYEITIKKNIKYGAKGICSRGGQKKLHFYSNYLFFVCIFDSQGSVETSIAIFEQTQSSGEMGKIDIGFYQRNPIDLIHHPVSSLEQNLNVIFDFDFNKNGIFYFTSTPHLIDMYQLNMANSVEFEDVSEIQEQRLVNFQLQVANIFQEKSVSIEYFRVKKAIDIGNMQVWMGNNKPFVYVMVLYFLVVVWMILTKNMIKNQFESLKENDMKNKDKGQRQKEQLDLFELRDQRGSIHERTNSINRYSLLA